MKVDSEVSVRCVRLKHTSFFEEGKIYKGKVSSIFPPKTYIRIKSNGENHLIIHPECAWGWWEWADPADPNNYEIEPKIADKNKIWDAIIGTCSR